MTWPSYPSTKPSDVEWLGSVPSHWVVRELKWSSPVRRGASPRPIDDPKYFDDDGEWSWVRIADVSASDGLLKETTQRLSQLGSSLSVKLNPGSLFVSIAGTVGKPCITTIPACIHDGFVYFPDLDLNPQFLFWIFESGECYKGLGKFGTQLNLNTDTIGSIRMPVPPPSEQQAIVAFLDSETTKIDALITKQEQLIATLCEDRTATITHAVSKGLEADASPPDDIAGLGGIPAGWTVRPFLRCVQGRVDYRGATPKKVADGVLLVTARNVRPGWIDYEVSEEYVAADEYADIMRRGLPEIDDLLFTMEAPLGNAALVDRTDIALAQRIIKFRPDREVVRPRFLLYSVMGDWFQSQLVARATGSTALGLKASKLPELRIAVPDLDEQSLIVKFLDEQGTRIDELVAKAIQVIDTLQEYRSALVTDAVTGKIDVREAVA
ncbi:restriction endonuclease subunit S [Mycobacterium sp. NPDC049093]